MAVSHPAVFCRFLALLLLVFTGSLSGSLFAQQYYFKTLTVNEGLSQHDVSAIHQDSYGFIWIATYDGLNQFDGYAVKTFHKVTGNANSLPGNRIKCLQEDSQKRLWIGTEGAGLAYYALLQQKFIRVETPESYQSINDIIELKDGRIYISTTNGLLEVIEKEEPYLKPILISQQVNIRSMLEGNDGKLYLAGLEGIYIYENDLLKVVPGTNNVQFLSLCFDQKGNIVAGSTNGLFILKPSGGQYQIEKLDDFKNKTIHSVIQDLGGDIWVGTHLSGLIRIDGETHTVESKITATTLEQRGLMSNTVLNLFCDNTNNLWVGNRKGLCYTNLTNVGFSSLKMDNVLRPHVRSIYLNGTQAYLGVNNHGLFVHDLKKNNTRHLLKNDIRYVNDILKLGEYVYVCSSNGLYQSAKNMEFNKANAYWTDESPIDENITTIAIDGFGRKYLGTHNGLILDEDGRASWIWSRNPSMKLLKGTRIFTMDYDDETRALRIGTISKGFLVVKMDEKGNWISTERIPLNSIDGASLVNTSVWCFYEDRQENLWIGTDAGVFLQKSGSSRVDQLPIKGIIDKKIMSIIQGREGSLWLSNSQGLICYNPETNVVRKYTYNDGLLSGTLTEGSAEDANGTLYFGTSRGVNFINPSRTTVNPYTSGISISKFSVHNEPIIPGEEYYGTVILDKNINSTSVLSLSHLQNNFTVEFTGTNYANVQENSFRYKLVGYNDDWVVTDAGKRFASYSNLRPGKYQLILDAANQDGVWSGNPKVVNITISPSPWKTPWAYVLYVFAVGGVIAGFVYFWFNRQKLNHQIQLDQIKLHRDQEVHELQLRFFTDVAHEFKTPLSLIISPLNDLMNRVLSQDKRDFCFQIVSRNVQRMTFLVNQLLDFSKINAALNILRITRNDLKAFLIETTKAFQWQIQNENISFRMSIPDCKGYFDRDILEKAIYNVLSNAFKHTPKNGTIELRLEVIETARGQSACITISDSGMGIPDSHKDRVFERFFHDKDRASSGIGLHLTHSLIKAHKGQIKVTDSVHGGAQFELYIPISPEVYDPADFYEGPNQDNTDKETSDSKENTEEVAEDKETILIVEDDHDLRSYLKVSLQEEYNVLEASNGSEGLKLATTEIPDIIISDVMMPLMDGIEMCRYLKNDNQTSHIPILMLTAKTGTEYKKQGLSSGAWDYIAKPFDTEALLQKVHNIIDTRNKFKSYLANQKVTSEIKSHYTTYDQKIISRITQAIEDNLQDPQFTVSELAREVGLSRMHLHRKLKTLVGESTTSFVNRIKIKKTTELFDQGCDRIQEAMDAVGITNYAHFNNNFKKIMGMTATEYLARLKEERGGATFIPQ